MAAKKKNEKLHYDKEALEKEYTQTYAMFMKVMVIGIGGAVAFFFGMIVYLGGWSHTPHKEFFDTFKDRFTVEYEGTKLPMYDSE